MATGEPRGSRILVVEDNIINQKVVFHQLRHLGYQAEIVSNGHEALAALGKASYDIVFMDCEMPEMDGYEATRIIRLCEEEDEHIYIVAMTAHAGKEYRARCLEAGMDDYMAKPFGKETLATILERWSSFGDAVTPA